MEYSFLFPWIGGLTFYHRVDCDTVLGSGLGSCLCSTAVPVCGLLPCPNLSRQWVEGAQGWVRLTPLCLQIKFILHSLSEAQVSRRALKVQEGVRGWGWGGY